MARRSLRVLSCGGDSILAEWDTETLTPENLESIEKEYNRYVMLGMVPADITDKRNEIVTGEAFNPNADTLMIPRMQGGGR